MKIVKSHLNTYLHLRLHPLKNALFKFHYQNLIFWQIAQKFEQLQLSCDAYYHYGFNFPETPIQHEIFLYIWLPSSSVIKISFGVNALYMPFSAIEWYRSVFLFRNTRECFYNHTRVGLYKLLEGKEQIYVAL